MALIFPEKAASAGRGSLALPLCCYLDSASPGGIFFCPSARLSSETSKIKLRLETNSLFMFSQRIGGCVCGGGVVTVFVNLRQL